jgi:aspartyl-tRNA(Asn)/glutamyl-tRNA(Gln) amidotransferase subunit C
MDADQSPSPPPLDSATVRRVAHLSRLALSDDQVEAFRAQLGAVLGHIDRLRALALEGVEPLTHPLDATNRMDEDTARDPLGNEVLIGMAPDVAAPFIKVPKVLAGAGDGA